MIRKGSETEKMEKERSSEKKETKRDDAMNKSYSQSLPPPPQIQHRLDSNLRVQAVVPQRDLVGVA